MKEIINRARSAMNLVLILSILTWWINYFSIDVLKEIKPDFNSLVQVVDDFYNGSNVSILMDINTKESQFVSKVLNSLQFYRPKYEDSSAGFDKKLLEFAKKHKMIDIMQTSELLTKYVIIITAHTIENGSMEIGGKYNQLTMILVHLGTAYNSISEKLKDFSSQPALDANATILEAHRALQKKLEVPVLNLNVKQSELNQFFALSIGLILFYLLSTTFAMHRLCKTAPSEEILQWIFFHPTPVGIVIGVLWLFSPVATLAANQRWVEATVVGVLVSVVVGSVIKCRVAVNKRERKPPLNKGHP
jgi:hypothetical protein